MSISENNQSWLNAKEIFEQMIHLNKEEMLKHLERNDISDSSVKKKVVKLIEAMDHNKTLFNQKSPLNIFESIGNLMDWSGREINSYLLEELVAVGGMSSVYRARRLSSEVQKPVAIKVMKPHKNDDSIVALFKQEQKALSVLDHPNIVSFQHGDQTKQGVYYLVMEFISNANTLDLYIQQNNCDVRTIVSLIKKVAEAMTYAHSHLIIHKDLKASNILVDQHDTPKVIDFGIAALANNPSPTYHKIYTPTIASPEQIKGEKITAVTDVFSLSATLLDVLIDDSPLPSFDPETYKESNDDQYVTRVLKSAKIDQDLKTIIAKGLQTKLEDRYKTMGELASDLEAWLAHKPISVLNHKMGYRLKKTFQRNPLSSIALSLFFAAVLLATVLISYYAINAKKQAENSRVTLLFLSDILSQSDPSEGNASDMTIRQALKTTLDQQKAILADNPEMKLNILNHVTQIYKAQGLHLEAAETLEQLYELLKESKGEQALVTMEKLKSLANQLQAAGQFDEAIMLSKQLLSQLKPKNIHHVNLKFAAMYIIMKSNLGRMNHKNMAFDIKQLLDLIDQGEVNDHQLMGEAYLTIALWTTYKKDQSMLENYYQKGLFHLEEADGKTNPTYADALRVYAQYLSKKGKHEQAEPLLLESIELAQNYDPLGSSLGKSLHRYASFLFLTGRDDEGYKNLQQALSIIKQAGGSFLSVEVHQSLYKFHKRKLQFALSLNGLTPAIEMARKKYKDHEIPVAINVLRVAEVLALMNEYPLAEKSLASLLTQESKIHKLLQDDLKFKSALIAWSKNTDLKTMTSKSNNDLIEILEKYKLKNKQSVKVNRLAGKEYEQLRVLLTQISNNDTTLSCQDIDKITATTDLLVVKVIANLCPEHKPRLEAFNRALLQDKNILTQKHLDQVRSLINKEK